MKILMTHGWVRGNLGDFCMTRVFLGALKSAFPDAEIDFVSIPGDESGLKKEILPFVSRYRELSYSEDLTAEFKNYTAVINTPGGGLQKENDERGFFMLRDAAACKRLGVPHIFSGHSFHPSFETDSLAGSFISAREPASWEYLKARGLEAAPTADPAFLQPLPAIGKMRAPERVLLFLRFDHFKKITLSRGKLNLDGRKVQLPDGQLTLATSDRLRDAPLLSRLAAAWKVPYLPSPDLDHLLHTIGGSAYVVSDRYHPVIFSKMLSVPFIFLQREGSLRDEGLQRLLKEKTAAECAVMARHGLDSIFEYLHNSSQLAAEKL